MKAKAFVTALSKGRWQHVMTKRDFGRILEIFNTTIDSDGDGCLIGFALLGSPTRVLWTDVELIRTGILLAEEYPPNLPPGREAFDWRVAGFVFVENPDAEPSELLPSRSGDRPWLLADYPGRVSWARLRKAADRLGPTNDWRALKYGDPFAYWWRAWRGRGCSPGLNPRWSMCSTVMRTGSAPAYSQDSLRDERHLCPITTTSWPITRSGTAN